MTRSRMFRDDEPLEAGSVSPRTTIVGGRPPEEGAELPPVPTGIQKLLRLAEVDEAFRRELLVRRSAIAAAAQVELTRSESAILDAVPADQLVRMIGVLPPPPASRRTFLRQTASTAVMLLGGAVLAECAGCAKGGATRSPAAGDGDAAAPTDEGVAPPLDVGAAAPADVPQRPDVDLSQVGGGAAPDMPPLRPVERMPPTAGVRPNIPGPSDEEPEPPRPEDNPMTLEGGISPHVPEPPDAGETDDGAYAPPPPTRGIQPDMPPARPVHNINAPGGVRPDGTFPFRK